MDQLAVLSVERESPDGNIRTLGDAVWWSFTTMTTVGYGDHAPTTGLGRVIAVGLMLSGIALLGVVTANIEDKGAASRSSLIAGAVGVIAGAVGGTVTGPGA